MTGAGAVSAEDVAGSAAVVAVTAPEGGGAGAAVVVGVVAFVEEGGFGASGTLFARSPEAELAGVLPWV